ncbi:MAG: ribonuclease III [Betaproteobacteria bacterium]|nr:ribonuclease III [Betaproteobacteria bacterium]
MSASALETRLGHQFADAALLKQALTHRSFGVPHNERLEFLGDSVLNCAIAALVYAQYPDMPEGQLSRLRANLVNQASLAAIAINLELGDLLRLGEGEHKTGGNGRPSILADAVEALLGAIFLDAGFDKAAATVRLLFAARLESADEGSPAKDAKTALQEWLQARRLPLPEYTVLKIEGEAHRQKFHVRCEIPSQVVTAIGQGHSRRAAEQDAATQAFAMINEQSSGKTR